VQSSSQSSPPANQHPTFYRPDAISVTQPTVYKHVTSKNISLRQFTDCAAADICSWCCCRHFMSRATALDPLSVSLHKNGPTPQSRYTVTKSSQNSACPLPCGAGNNNAESRRGTCPSGPLLATPLVVLICICLSVNTLFFNGHFPDEPGIASTRMSLFWILLELRMIRGGGDNWSYKTCTAAVKLSPPAPNSTFYSRVAQPLPVPQPTVSECLLTGLLNILLIFNVSVKWLDIQQTRWQ